MSETEPIYLTSEGAADLKRELQELINVRRPELAIMLKEAIADGDLKENANYHDAKEKQALLEGRIHQLENVLRAAIIVESTNSGDIVSIGSEVTIREEGTDEDETYFVVGAAEANPRENKISNQSPIGAALMGRKKGDKVKVETPGGKLAFKIRKIK